MAWNWDQDYHGDGYYTAPAQETAAPAANADAGMDDFLASARKLTDRFLEQSRRQAEKILADANAQAEQIVGDARKKADEIVSGAGRQAEEITLRARHEADAMIAQAQAEAETIRSEAAPPETGTIDQEYAVRCVSDCFDEIRRRQEETLDILNAQWQKFLIGLIPTDDMLPGPEPKFDPSAGTETPETAEEPETEPELPYDLEEKVSALSREMDELFRNRKN